jgi:tRNA (cytidine/uridine-2'-O-)-methyltransferase
VWDKGGIRLRAQPRPTPFHLVLVEPEIPPNTGNAARLCAATGCRLHLVHPLGFSTDDKAVRRAGLDYWHLVDVVEHASLDAFETARGGQGRRYLFTGKTGRSFLDVHFELGDYLVFGRESSGLPDELTDAFPEECVAIPTLGPVRSLNLANAAALGVYEALRQTGCLDNPTLG